MKKIYGFLGAFALLSLAACSSDEPLVNNGGYTPDDGRVAYINATIALPTSGGRSATDDKGDSNSNGSSDPNNGIYKPDDPTSGSDVEVGRDAENTVRTMILVVTDKQDRYLTHLVVTGMKLSPNTGSKVVYNTVARIPYSTLTEAYGPNGLFSDPEIQEATKPMHLYAFCNFTQNMLSQFNKYQDEVKNTSIAEDKRPDALLLKWREFKGGVVEKASMAGETPQTTNSIWSPHSFLMSNSKVYDSTFPATIEEWDVYADDNNPLNLTGDEYGSGPIDVERTAARIDFRDASPDGKLGYPLIDDNSGKNLYSVRLSRMVLVNMSNNFYYLRRVSKDGLNTSNPEYAGVERPTGANVNYVVDSDADVKKLTTDGFKGEPGVNVENAENYFNFPLYSKNTSEEQVFYNNMYGTYGWYITNISDIIGKDENKDNWDGTKGGSSVDYYTWRYVTENTIPEIDQQKTVQSTGVIFKASIEVGEEAEGIVSSSLIEALNACRDNEDKVSEPTMNDGSALPAIYSFHNTLYGGVPDIVRAAAASGQGSPLWFAIDPILNNWYLKEGEKVFKYMPNGTAPTAEQLLETVNDDGTTDPAEYVQLNFEIADEILNSTPVTDGSKDYGITEEVDGKQVKVYSIDFTNPDAPESLAKFVNSQFIELCPTQNITVFIPTNDDKEGWGYYCYYFYWMRHNDNGLAGKMGPMEFATVRNNVYKLAVTKINSIGHPRDTTRDPDPVKPGDPDEDPERSIEVEVNILPWVVRVNDIEF